MSRKPGLPLVRGTGNPQLDLFCQSVKQTLDGMTSQAPNKPRLQPLPETATLAEVIAQLNEVVARLQD